MAACVLVEAHLSLVRLEHNLIIDSDLADRLYGKRSPGLSDVP